MRRTYAIDFGKRIDQPGGIFVRTDELPNGERPRLQSTYRLNKSSIIFNFGARLPPKIADLLDIGVAVALADRVSPRSRAGRELTVDESGVRCLRVCIPVRTPEHWSQSRVREALSNALLEYSGDDWTFEFIRRSDPSDSFSEQLPLEIPTVLTSVESVLVYSGGLDSLLGLLHLVESNGYRSIALASVSTHPRLSAVQIATSTAVRDNHRLNLLSSRLQFGLTRDFPLNERESSQRARAFLFLVNGIANALLAGLTTLTVFENGIGAINLPYMLGQLGHRSNRAMHPRTLQAVARLVEEAFEQPFQIVNPALWQTKQQIVRRFEASPAFLAAAPMTVSCDRFPYKPQDQPCGVCTSCILRRMSLLGAKQDSIDTGMNYDFDVLVASFQEKARHALVPLIAMNGQVEHIRSHQSDFGELQLLLQRFPDFADIFDVQAERTMEEVIVTIQWLSDLYSTYVNEWTSFIAQSGLPAAQVTYVPRYLNLDERRFIAS